MDTLFSLITPEDIQGWYMGISLLIYLPLLLIIRQQGRMSKMFSDLNKENAKLRIELNLLKTKR